MNIPEDWVGGVITVWVDGRDITGLLVEIRKGVLVLTCDSEDAKTRTTWHVDRAKVNAAGRTSVIAAAP